VTDHWDGTHPEDVLSLDDETRYAEWQVLVEETVGFGRDSYCWRVTKVRPCADRNEARQYAYQLAQEYRPEHPMSPQGRRIFQIGIDTWVVQVPGATTDFHFRVSAARLMDVHDKKGNSLMEA
jgi:hypothetical protein